jgi:protoporphyrinogen/coproporphyrinogen III oxidase
MENTTYDTIILGGGISGLVAAYSQQKKSKNVFLLEASNRVGGVIQTVAKEGYRLEQGPNSILTNAELSKLIEDLGISDKVRKNEEIASTRYLLYKDMPLKMAPSWNLLKSGFLNFSMVWAFLSERFRKKGELEDESIADFIRRRLNKDILNRMINPLVTGVYAGDPERLSLRSTFKKLYAMEQNYGSLVKAMFNRDKNAHKREAMSFEGGLNGLILGLENNLEGKIGLGAKVLNVDPVENGFEIIYEQAGSQHTVFTKKVISTLPTTTTGTVFNFMDADLRDELNQVEYAPMLLVYLGYPKENVGQGLNGFGYLNAQQENQPYLGGIWTSAIFPEVAKEGNELFTLFVGGVNNKLVVTKREEAVEKAKRAFEKHMKISGESSFQSHYLYERAIPQFNLGYYKLMDKVDDVEKQYPSLHISGNWRSGVAIGDCVAYNLAL